MVSVCNEGTWQLSNTNISLLLAALVPPLYLQAPHDIGERHFVFYHSTLPLTPPSSNIENWEMKRFHSTMAWKGESLTLISFSCSFSFFSSYSFSFAFSSSCFSQSLILISFSFSYSFTFFLFSFSCFCFPTY